MTDLRLIDAEAARVMARVARTFDLAALLLPAERRRDVRRLYLVLRTLDDLVDRGHPAAASRVAEVERWARGETPEAGPLVGPEAPLLAELARRYPGLPRDAVLDFCEGMRADLAGLRPQDDAALDRYCYLVAGTVGRLVASVLEVDGAAEAARAADEAARALGRAMQRTNIVRDVIEDARAGRVYLPADALASLGVDRGREAEVLAASGSWPVERRRALLGRQIARADADYATGMAGIRHLRSGRRAIIAAARLYQEILRQVERDGYGAAGRSHVGRWRKARIVMTSVVGART